MTIAIIRVHQYKLPEMNTICYTPENISVSTGLAACLIIRSETGIAAIEGYQGPYQKEVRAMATEIRELFPAEPEEALRGRLGGEGAREKLQCKVCSDTPGMCYTNMFLTALEKIRPAEAESATQGELSIRTLNRNCFGRLRDIKHSIDRIAKEGLGQSDNGVALSVCQYVAAVLKIMDSEESKASDV